MLGSFKPPKDDKRMSWTNHVTNKMRQYSLSEQRIRRVLRNPDRTEEAIVPGLVAIMQKSSKTAKHPHEIWVMYQLMSKSSSSSPKIRIISAWRYPGETEEGEDPPIPEDILKEIHQLLQT